MIKPRLSRVARTAAAVAAALFVVLLPDVASASTTVKDHTVLPLLDCVTANADGTYTGVLGYNNTSSASVTIPFSDKNVIAPKAYDGVQPTTFAPGVHHGVFSLTVPASAGAVSWSLNGTKLDSNAAGTASVCPPPTEMPATGNGTGLAIALLGAGVIGALAVARMRTRRGGSDA